MRFLFPIIFLSCSVLSGQINSTTLDLIKRVESLEKRIADLEKANTQTQQSLSEVEKKADKAKSISNSNISLPTNEIEKKSFMSKLRIELKSYEAKSHGPWTKEKTWHEMRRNLTEFKVRKLLGNPSQIKGSLNPRIERVYYYIGDLDADGKDEEGLVNFFKGKAVSHKSPF